MNTNIHWDYLKQCEDDDIKHKQKIIKFEEK